MIRRFLMGLGLMMLAATTAIANGEISNMMRAGDAKSGALLLHSNEAGIYLPAPTVHTDVKISISGPLARTTVTQRFTNPSDRWVEGIYVFPLPETAAVDHLKMQVGNRFIEGTIKERESARKMYERAKREGRKAGLVEQERANVFTSSVANIGPHQSVVVQIEYQESMRYDNGLYRLRFPLVVGPRFNPMAQLISHGDELIIDDPVPDRDRINPPVTPPETDYRLPVSISVALDAGFPVAQVKSAHHRVVINRESPRKILITLKDKTVPANRDFELTWGPKPGTAPNVGIFTEILNGETYALISVVPPKVKSAARVAREVIFVLDISGSMSGRSIRQAKAGLELGLNRLTDADSFNVIFFNDRTGALFDGLKPATRTNLTRAKSALRALEAGGGTAMLPALKRALEIPVAIPDDGAHSGRLRQIVFLTDGAVGNETQLFEVIADGLGDARLFTVGIGSAPNSYFMRRAARLGRGSFTYIGSTEQITVRMGELLEKLEQPVLTDVRASWPWGTTIESFPSPIPDLYYGEPVSIIARLSKAGGKVVLTGNFGDEPWQTEFDITAGEGSVSGVAVAWARDKISSLEESRIWGADQSAVRDGILELALKFNLVSRYTSLVAIDVTPSRPEGEGLTSRSVPLMLPDGWNWDKVFGGQSVTPAASRPLRSPVGTFGLRTASLSPLVLPQTATPARMYLVLGILLVLWGAAILLIRRRPICA